MTQHDARMFAQSHPSEDAFDVRPDTPEFKSQRSATVEQRLDAIEMALGLTMPAMAELIGAVEQHQEMLTKLIEMPGHVRDAMVALAEDQSKANLTMMIKLDQHNTLIEELMEVVDELRGEDDDLPLDDYDTEGHVFNFDIETYDFADHAADAAAYAAINEAAEAKTNYVREEGEFIIITMPKTPTPGDIAENEVFDAHLSAIVTELGSKGIIDEEVAETLLGGIEGTMSPERAQEVLPRGDASAGLPEALTAWWEIGEEAQLGIHMGNDLDLAASHVIAFACATSAMVNIVATLAEAMAE
ncbi:hypothetical protein MAL1_00225 [Bacteriophage DSS3_MAL1]|nr:hypothetical protein MAL1_00225 [Bacteriophage DSS3_MAL1]